MHVEGIFLLLALISTASLSVKVLEKPDYAQSGI